MNAYTIALIFAGIICGSLGKHNPYQDSLNVGTVLFSPSDYTKPRWNKSSIALLQARQYFQDLIPPPNYIDANTEYVDKLLNYFQAAYSSIKKVTKDPELDIIMTKALSDTIGGYLKQWILPITKIAFYGGTVTSKNAAKLFNFYSEIKQFLRTDGSGWKEPDPRFISCIHISVTRTPQLKYIRDVDPCNLFAYLENTMEGLTIPLPYIDWNEKTLFIPLKEYPLISLYSRKHTQALERYYDAAKNCLASNNPNVSANFEKRFQRWLSHDVVPHLSDDTLYIALGSVLGMVNKTKDLYATVMDMYHTPQETTDYNSFFNFIPINYCSKKTIIIGVILLLEVIWCIVALRQLCVKKKAKPGCCQDVFMFFKADINKCVKPEKPESKVSFKHVYPGGSVADIRGGGIKFFQRPKTKRYDFGAQCPSKIIINKQTMGTNTFYSKIDSKGSKEVVKIVDENSQTKKKLARLSGTKSSMQPQPKDIPYLFPKSMTTPELGTLGCNAHSCCNCPCTPVYPSDTNTPNYMNSNTDIKNYLSFVTVQEKQPSKTITLYKKSQKSIERAMCESDENSLLIRRMTVSEQTGLVLDRTSKPFTPSNSRCDCACCDDDTLCPCTSYLQSNEETYLNQEHVSSVCSCKSSLNKKVETAIDQSKVAETFTKSYTHIMSSDKGDETKMQNIEKSLTVQTQKEVMITKKKEDTWNFDQAFVEIKIDRPETEIRVGISGLKSSDKHHRRSRIPKKALTTTRHEQADNHTGISEEAFNLNEQIISKAMKSIEEQDTSKTHKKIRETVEGKPIKDAEQIQYKGTRSNREESKRRVKVTRKSSRRTDSDSRTHGRNAGLPVDTALENTEQVPLKEIKLMKNDADKGSKTPFKFRSTIELNSGTALNVNQGSLSKPDRDMNKVSALEDPNDVVEASRAISERVAKVEKDLKAPDEVICIYKHAGDLYEKKLKTSNLKLMHKSLIPKLKRCTVDDTLIEPDKARIKDNKLNITL